jgi:hypothetical protein
VVLFGGEGTDLAALGDTWEWDGVTWSQKSDFGPTPLARATLSARGQGLAILFGGNPAPAAPPTEASSLTWEWDGTHWALRQHLGPTPRFGQAAAFDDARGRIVLSGGLVPSAGGASEIAGDTWEMFELAGSDSTTGPPPNANNVSGIWNLQSINGTALPATLGTGVTSLTVKSSVLTMTGNASGSFSELMSVITLNSVNATQTKVGTWVSNSGSVTFNDATDQSTYLGSVTGGTLITTNGAVTRVYSR